MVPWVVDTRPAPETSPSKCGDMGLQLPGSQFDANLLGVAVMDILLQGYHHSGIADALNIAHIVPARWVAWATARTSAAFSGTGTRRRAAGPGSPLTS